MKNTDQWKPTFIHRDQKSGEFILDFRRVYPGSIHISNIQWKAYKPLFLKWCKGKLLDAGCGRIPYYAFLKEKVDAHYCVDYSTNPEVIHCLDEVCDFSEDFSLREKNFDIVLLSDVIAHVPNPQLLIRNLSAHLRPGGVLVITTPCLYWLSEYPHNYYYMTDAALKNLCEEAGLHVEVLESYGGYPDVLLDTLNKGMTGAITNRIFRVLASVVKKSGWYRRTNEKTKYSYPIGYVLAATKRV